MMFDMLNMLTVMFSLTVWFVIFLVLFLFVIYIYDYNQSSHAVLRNFPVIGHFRYWLEGMGEYFRQYFFANDREELPFNRATRNWVYRTAKGLGGIIGFGSTNDLREPGTIIFVSSPYPALEEECTPSPGVVIGEQCDKPFVAKKVFNISGMSYGALSAPAVKALSKGAAKAGVWINTGEGGLSSHHKEGDCDRIFQIGTAKYGVRGDDGKLSDKKLLEVAQFVNAFEVKISQGAKPGRGGVLPAIKVSEEISQIRGIPINVISSSPNRHREIKSADDLLDMIMRIRDVTGKPVGFKAVFSNETFPESIFDAVLRRGPDSAPDFVTVDGGDGGTGAAPQILADHVGLSLVEALPMFVNTLTEAGLKDRIKVIASGRLVTSAKVAWALCAGADFAVSGRGFMFSLGCIQSLQCHMDTCPTGITTHNKRLQRGLVVDNKAKRVANYAHWVNVEVDKLAHSCGLQNARAFRREHVRLVQTAYQSEAMNVLYPYPEVKNTK